MSVVSEKYHDENLRKNNINIRTKYIVGSNILQRNTDNSVNEEIKNGIRCEKNYIVNGSLKHTEKVFDSRIEYTFLSNLNSDTIYTCPNCGASGRLSDFIDGCPYCKTYYNIDYVDKELGNKYHYDRVLRSNTYKTITAIVDFTISLILSFIFIKYTSRTFNNYDVYKIFIYGVILALILYYIFYILDAYVILGPIKAYKDKQNKRQIEFWNRTKIDKKKFFNNVNYELSKHYYANNNIIDYDIIDYLEFKEYISNEEFFVEVRIDIRVVYFLNGKISSKNKTEKFTFKKNTNEVMSLNGEVNIITCPHCGGSVDVNKGVCDYCKNPIKSIQEWILVNK